MPIYEYECRKCGVFEHSQSITEDPLKRCPQCRSAVQKLLSASAFHLKGGGWYSDGYDKKGDSSSGGEKSPATDSATKKSPSDSKSSSKKKTAKGSGKASKSADAGG